MNVCANLGDRRHSDFAQQDAIAQRIMYHPQMPLRYLRLLLAFGVIVALAVLSAGCGGSSAQEPDSKSSTVEVPPEAAAAASFLQPGSPTNGLVKFGHEAWAPERKTASAVLTRNLEARQEADFATQCATLSQYGVESVTGKKKGTAAVKACPTALKALAMPLSRTKPFRVNRLAGEIDALRVKGDQGQALYHGDDGKDYAMPMTKEGIGWTVGSILTTELNPPDKP